jgi:hypothetical protein
MVDTALLLHANLLYAEFPFSEIPTVIDKSYLPVLEMLEKNPDYKVILNWTGFTLDVLNGTYPEYGEYPEVIALIKKLLERGQVEITGTSWSHAILPLLPVEDVRRDIALFGELAERILGVKPRGFFPPELAIDPLLPLVLRENGYEYSFIDHDIMRYTLLDRLNVANDFKPVPPSFLKELVEVARQNPVRQLFALIKMNRLIKELSDMHPIVWEGAGDCSITAIRSYQPWNSYTLSCLGRMAIMNERRLFKMLDTVSSNREGFFLPFSTDFEFYGYGGNVKEDPIPVARLQSLLEYIHRSPHLNFTLPSEHLKKVDTKKLTHLYLRSGSWSSDGDFALWDIDPDNKRLNEFVREVREKYHRVGHALKKNEREEVEKAILLSQNSDGRGWTPVAEHRLFCYNKALSALNILDKVS